MRKPRKLKRIFSASETIAFSKWNYPITSTLRQEAGVKKTSYPQGADVELLDDFYSQMWSKRAKWIDPTNTFCRSILFFFGYIFFLLFTVFIYLFCWGGKKNLVLHILATHPSYRRRGVGSLLLTHGLEVVDDANSQSYLDTSPLGLKLYLKYGWRAVDEIRVDLGKYGIDQGGEEVSLCMIREPKGS